MTYKAPLPAINFLLNHVVPLNRLPAHETLGTIDGDMAMSILEPAAKLAEDVLAPLNPVGDQKGAVLKEGDVIMPDGFQKAYQTYCEGGWNAVPFEEEHGGQALPWLLAFPVQEFWQGANMAFGLCPLLNQGAVEAIAAHGSDEQKAFYLPKLVSGEWTGTMNLTEPQAGSDLSQIRTRAQKQADGTYKISGQKIYITYGEHNLAENIIHLVLARLPDAPEGVKGISLFIVPKFLEDGSRNDVKCTGLEHKIGIHASPTCTMQFGDKGGAIGYLIGAENEGLKYMFTMMNNARLSVGLQGVAVAEHAYQKALDYARERDQGASLTDKALRVKIAAHGDVKRMLLSMRSSIFALRALTYEAALHLDLAANGDDKAQGVVEFLTPIVKAYATDQAVEIANTGIQIHGGMGYVEETGAAQFLRDARILPIYEGTNGIQALDLVFRKIAKGHLDHVLHHYKKEADNLAAALQNAYPEFSTSLINAADIATLIYEHIQNEGRKYPDKIAAVAVPALQALGIFLCGVMQARSLKAISDQKDDIALKKHIEENAAYYAAFDMAKLSALLHTVQQGGNIITNADFLE